MERLLETSTKEPGRTVNLEATGSVGEPRMGEGFQTVVRSSNSKVIDAGGGKLPHTYSNQQVTHAIEKDFSLILSGWGTEISLFLHKTMHVSFTPNSRYTRDHNPNALPHLVTPRHPHSIRRLRSACAAQCEERRSRVRIGCLGSRGG